MLLLIQSLEISTWTRTHLRLDHVVEMSGKGSGEPQDVRVIPLHRVTRFRD